MTVFVDILVRSSTEIHEPFWRKPGIFGRGLHRSDPRQEPLTHPKHCFIPWRGAGSGSTLLPGGRRTPSPSNRLRVDPGRQQDSHLPLSTEGGHCLVGNSSYSHPVDQNRRPQNGLAEEPVPLSLLPRRSMYGSISSRRYQGKKKKTFFRRKTETQSCFCLSFICFTFQGTKPIFAPFLLNAHFLW